MYGEENGVWRDPGHRPRWSNSGVVVGPVTVLKATLNKWRNTTEWLQWQSDQVPFNRALAKNETTVDYYGDIVWTGGADLDSFKAVSITEPVDGTHSMIPYGPLLPKLGMSVTTGQIPAILHYNMGTSPTRKDALSKDEAFDMISEQLWWFSGKQAEFREIALRELYARRIYIGAFDKVGKTYDEVCREHSM